MSRVSTVHVEVLDGTDSADRVSSLNTSTLYAANSQPVRSSTLNTVILDGTDSSDRVSTLNVYVLRSAALPQLFTDDICAFLSDIQPNGPETNGTMDDGQQAFISNMAEITYVF